MLVLLPFAGGSSFSYTQLNGGLAATFEVRALDTPGHGRRMKEPLLNNCDAMAEDIVTSLQRIVPPDQPYAIYGHSMGALLGHLVIRKLVAAGQRLPVHFFASGRSGPSFDREREIMWSLPGPAFRERLKQLDLMTDELLNNEVLMEIFEPVLRSDFRAVETFVHHPQAPYAVPVTVLNGTEDDLNEAAAAAWQKETTLPVKLYWFEGGHFFLFKHIQAVCQVMIQTLGRVNAGTAL